jgi:predicted MFS family arabinose efflux permease
MTAAATKQSAAGVDLGAGVGISTSSLLLLAACNFTVGSGAMSLTGLIAPVAADLGVSTGSAAQLLTAYALAFAISAPVVALLAARVCRKKLLVWAMFVFGVLTTAAAVAPGFITLWVLRAAVGVAAAAFVPNASAVAATLAAPAQRGRALALVFGGFTAALVLGAPLGSYVGQAFGWRWTFGVLGAAALVLALAIKLRLPGGIMVPGATLAAFKSTLTQWRLVAMLGINATSALGTFVLFGLASVAFPALLGAPAAVVASALLVFGLGSLLGNVVSAYAVDRLGPVALATGALLVCTAALAVLAAELSAGLAWAALVVWGCASFAASTAMQARLVAASPALASALLPLNSSSQFVGQSFGAVAGGLWLVQRPDAVQGLAWIGCLALAIAAVASGFLGPRGRLAGPATAH